MTRHDAEIYTMDVLEDDEFEVPERFKNIINTGNIKKKIGNAKIILKPNEGYYRKDEEEFEILKKETE